MSDLDNINPPVIFNELGTLHPINQTKNFLLKLLSDLGFEEVHGPEIETEEFNFDMLNIKKSHPARQMHDTFYTEGKKKCTENSHFASTNKKYA
jgi:phenylalanyl-tRNA synthetase alpha chain